MHAPIEMEDDNIDIACVVTNALNRVPAAGTEDLSLTSMHLLAEQSHEVEFNSQEISLPPLPEEHETLTSIHVFAHAQLAEALDKVDSSDSQKILRGLQTPSPPLHPAQTRESIMPQCTPGTEITIVQDYRPGLLGRVIEMHMDYYSRAFSFGIRFESYLASALGEFLSRLPNSRNQIWVAIDNSERILGSIFIDGQDLGANKAHLRAFIIDDKLRESGIGRRLLAEALAFVDNGTYSETHLWTFRGLDKARRMYEKNGFVLEAETQGTQFGEETTEQHFIRRSVVAAPS
ncbi:acyl-CoA N-acyltransferase [Bisporella sp. PMI_857]|nr:acyl-CoA N-acyltransferase [Bisporella sp. PMI_857]